MVSNMTIINTIFSNLQAESGAAIFVVTDSFLNITHSQFLHCTSNTGGLINLSSEVILTMISSTVDEFNGSAIVGDTTNIELYDVDISNGTSLHST